MRNGTASKFASGPASRITKPSPTRLCERAKGVLMERHLIDDASAFEMLCDQSRTSNRKIVDIAVDVADGHRLLP